VVEGEAIACMSEAPATDTRRLDACEDVTSPRPSRSARSLKADVDAMNAERLAIQGDKGGRDGGSDAAEGGSGAPRAGGGGDPCGDGADDPCGGGE
jgi:hypothetical protein